MGLTASIIQKKELSYSEISSANIFSIVMGLGFTIIIFLVSPLLERLFNTDNLAYYIKICSVLFLIRSASIIHEALLRKEMRFKVLTYIELITFIFGNFLVALTLAYLGFGVMSIIYSLLAQTLINSVLTIALSKFKFSFTYNWQEVKRLLNFGIPFTLGRFSMYLANQGDYIVIGKFLGPISLGYYNRSFQLMKTPVEFLGGTLSKVLFPAFSKIKDKKPTLKRIFLNSVFINAIFSLPVTCFLFLEADSVIKIILGEKWGDSVIPFKILVLSLFFRIGYKFIDPIINATGRPGYKAKFQFLYCILIIFAAYIGTKFGITSVAILVSVVVIIHYILMNIIVFDELSITIKELIPEIKYAVIISATFAILVITFKKHFQINNPYTEVFVSLIILFILYGLSLLVFKAVIDRKILWLFKTK
jgi:PST family polysaccharide transporter